MLPLGGFSSLRDQIETQEKVLDIATGHHWTSKIILLLYDVLRKGRLLYACTANINISTGRLSSSFRSDMTKLNVKKRAFEAPLKFSKVLKHPKGQKFATSTINKTIFAIFFAMYFSGHCVHANRKPLGLPGQATFCIVRVQEAAGAQEVHGGRVTAHL